MPTDPANPQATPPPAPARWPKLLPILLGPALAALTYILLGAFVPASALPLTDQGRAAAAVMVWMATWWLTEAAPLAATALLPLVLLPALGIASLESAAASYAGRVIYLFLGGFLLALAMERWNLHRRIALVTVLLVGTSRARLVAGFMLATAILSMWMSNTATAIMLVPIGATVVHLVAERSGKDASRFGVCLMLGIAYAASIGGVATPIGTPPNTFLLQFLAAEPFRLQISFLDWMKVGLPVVAIFLPIVWFLLTRFLFPLEPGALEGGRDLIRAEIRKLGPLSRAEKIVMTVFFSAVLGWLLRGLLLPWKPTSESLQWLPVFFAKHFDDSSIAMLAALSLFVIPVNLRQREFVLDWKTAEKLPWGILLLFGGGLALAGAVEQSGLSAWIGSLTTGLRGIPTILIILIVAAAIIYLTEVTSNTATANIFFPILAGVAVAGLRIDPLLLLVPAAIGASCAFMMPVATPPNAIVFSSGFVTMKHMASAGFWLNMISVVIVTIAAYTVVVWGLGAQTEGVPEWAAPLSDTLAPAPATE